MTISIYALRTSVIPVTRIIPLLKVHVTLVGVKFTRYLPALIVSEGCSSVDSLLTYSLKES